MVFLNAATFRPYQSQWRIVFVSSYAAHRRNVCVLLLGSQKLGSRSEITNSRLRSEWSGHQCRSHFINPSRHLSNWLRSKALDACGSDMLTKQSALLSRFSANNPPNADQPEFLVNPLKPSFNPFRGYGSFQKSSMKSLTRSKCLACDMMQD